LPRRRWTGILAPISIENRRKTGDRRCRLPGRIRCLACLGFGVLCFRNDVVNPLRGIRLADPGSRSGKLGEICLIRGRNVPIPQPGQDDAKRFRTGFLWAGVTSE
jgi:hypothetical protein